MVPSALDESPPRADRQENLPAPVDTSDAPDRATAGKAEKKKNPKTRDSAKKERYDVLKGKAADAGGLDELARIFKETVDTMKLFSSSSPTKACFQLLDELVERLSNHHEFPSADESRESFGSILSRSVSSPVKDLSAQVEANNRVIQSLTKSLETLKNAPITPPSPHPSAAPSYAQKAASLPSTKTKPPPLPNPEDERMLVRFNGPTPSILGLTYPQILSELNAHLASLGLPPVVYTQKQSATSIFVVPKTKADLGILTKRWDMWAPGIFPGAHMAPASTYCYIQIDGIPFATAGNLEEIKDDLEQGNPSLGKVVSPLMWVNKPPSEARISAIVASGRTPPTAGSLFVRLQSRDMVDRAILRKRVVLAGAAPVVDRGYPNLKTVLCWRCYKFGHTRNRCGAAEARCGGCGKKEHGAVCLEKPSCINCDGTHRADSFACPARKRITQHLRERAIETTRRLNEEMLTRLSTTPIPPLNPNPTASPFLSPLAPSPGLAQLNTLPNPSLALRLPESL
ncbi:hypothetical protein C8R43DRAFT_1127060 [Mycena crocata]|nr:hypothetical protein C8R43DRAFT_1127060 [Mycena crocata]